MAQDNRRSGFRPLADMAADVVDPVLRKRAGINLALVQSWEDILGNTLGSQSRPLKLLWPRRVHEDDPFQPATLVIACEGFTAIRIQHETGEIIDRVNGFLGFPAVGRIRIEQKPVSAAPRRVRPKEPVLDAAGEKKLGNVTIGIEDDRLRTALQKLGRQVMSRQVKK